MKVGTPDFVRERLAALRDARGISGAELARSVGVTRSAISQYERGEQTPSPLVLEKLAEALQVKPHFFVRPTIVEGKPVFYRSFSSATKSSRLAAETKLEWLREIITFLQQYIEFPSPAINELQDVVLDASAKLDEIEAIAVSVRRLFGIGDGPIQNVVQLLESKGIISVRRVFGTTRLDAFSSWEPTTPTPIIVLSSDKAAACRSRFDAAHELAHLVIHRTIEKSSLLDPQTFELIERQADRFAGALLLPASTFLSELVSLTPESFLGLKRRWGCSVALMIRRCQDLGVANEDVFRRLWINLSRRGWRSHEPLDDELVPEQPLFLQKCFELLLRERIIDLNEVEAHLPWCVEEIEELAGIKTGTLSSNAVPTVVPTLRTTA